MRTISTWVGLDQGDRGAVAAMGNFDGLHLGHQAVIVLARDAARAAGAPLGLVTFEPHPRQFFAPDAPAFRLMNAEARANRLAKLGIERLYELPFDAHLAGMEPERFATEVLAQGLGLKAVVVGEDFRFGKGRAGDAAGLAEMGARMGFATHLAPLLETAGGEVSSTAIRDALSRGQPREAAAMLGHWHRIEGEVLHGQKRGRDLGYPTANQALDGLHLPRFGVYAVLADVLSGPNKGSYLGAASLGLRPMFDGQVPNLETHLLDFSGDLYGQHLSVALVEYLRPEARFDGMPALISQMNTDCGRAREILTSVAR